MTYTATQQEVIRVFGRKELEFGCIFKYGDIYTRYCHRGISFHIVQKLNADTYAIGNEDFKKVEILGHIPHLEDVFRLARDRKMFYGIKGEYVKEKEFEYIEYIWFSNIDIGEKYIPYNPSIPLLEQPESVLIELLTIIKG